VVNQGKEAVVVEIDSPSMIKENEVLVRVAAAGLNPTDHKSNALGKPGLINGIDYAGVVELVGEKVEGWKIGDRIAGITHGNHNSDRGAFADFTKADPGLAFHTPDNITNAQAATFGCAVVTMAQSLYDTLKLPDPKADKSAERYKDILIWGGSSGMGMFAVQFAKLSGCRVIATCSPKNAEYVKSLGADITFDYKDPDVAQKIRKETDGELSLCLDCVVEGDSTKLCSDALAEGAHYTALLAPPAEGKKDGIKYTSTFAYTCFGYEMEIRGKKIPALPAQHDLGVKFWKITQELVESGALKPPRIRIIPGGLHGIPSAYEQLRNGKVSAEKLVVIVSDTK